MGSGYGQLRRKGRFDTEIREVLDDFYDGRAFVFFQLDEARLNSFVYGPVFQR